MYNSYEAYAPIAGALFFVFMIIGAIIGIILFLLILKRNVRKDVPLFPNDKPLPLTDVLQTYFSSIRYDANQGAIVLVKKEGFTSCVVSLITSNGAGKRAMKRFLLTFDEEGVAGIKVDGFNKFAIYVDSVDKRLIPHRSLDNNAGLAIFDAILVTIAFIAVAIFYVFWWRCMEDYYWPEEFNGFYAMCLLILLFPVVAIVGYLSFEKLSKKGAF